MNATTLGLRIARRRRQAGLTQVELAERMGTTQSAVSRLESGRTLPTFDLLERFASATRGPFEVVFGEEARLPDRAERRRRLRRALGRVELNPWERNPTPLEAEILEAEGLTRDRFEGAPEDRYLVSLREAATAEDREGVAFDLAVAIAVTFHEAMDWTDVEERIAQARADERLVGEAMEGVDGRVRRRARDVLTEP